MLHYGCDIRQKWLFSLLKTIVEPIVWIIIYLMAIKLMAITEGGSSASIEGQISIAECL